MYVSTCYCQVLPPLDARIAGVNFIDCKQPSVSSSRQHGQECEHGWGIWV